MLTTHPSVSTVQQVIVTAAHAGQRVDNFLASFLKGVPKSHLYRIIRKGEVRVNKRRVQVDYRLGCDDVVRIPPLRLASNEKPLPPRKIIKDLEEAIYEDEQLLILNKPAGLAVHGGSGISLGLIEALRITRAQAPFLELVHRLDRDTSGCVMIAKTRAMLTYLHQCLREGTIEKHYFALVQGQWQGGKVIEAPLLKYVLRSGERMVKVAPQGKFAQTTIKILKSYPQATLLQAVPLTGRTHQIRVHCAFMGHPIVGDRKYGKLADNRSSLNQCERLFLHAHQLVIQLPNQRQPLRVTSPLPSACQQYLDKIKTN